MKNFYNVTEAAKYLDISRQWFYKLKNKHGIEPSKRVQAIPYYIKEDIDKLRLPRI